MRPLRLLFVTPYVPSRLRPRPYGFIRTLSARGHRVDVLAASTSRLEAEDGEGLREICQSFEVVPISLPRSLWNCARGLAGEVPLQALFAYSPALAAALHRRLGGDEGIDLVHVEHLRAALLGLEIAGVPRVFDAVDCISNLFERASAEAPSLSSRLLARLDLERTRRFEGRLVRLFDGVLATSEAERAALTRLVAPGFGSAPVPDLRVIPNGVDTGHFSPGDTTRSTAEIVFVGRLSYHANEAAARHLVRDILPIVWRQRPEVHVTLVGAEPSATIRALGGGETRVAVTGRVPDVRPYLRRATLAACPLPYAVGIQNKILEAMACGTPVVASSAACAGLAAEDGVDLLRADGAADLARAILRLLDDPGLGHRLGAAGRAHVKARSDWNSVVTGLEELYQDVLARNQSHGSGDGPRGQR